MDISILIPTRNRRALAQLSTETALENSDDGCEVVVADNSDEALALVDHPRLRHLRPEGVLPMHDNWERALGAARGKWVMLLADKYMLAPGAIPRLRTLMDTGHSVISYGLAQLRQGLDAEHEDDFTRLRATGGSFVWPQRAGLVVRDSRADLDGLIRSAVYPRNFPMLYTALVRRDLLELARSKSGRFFLGSCPDVASALQILAHSSNWLATQHPVVMAQYPSESVRWSTGSSTLARGALWQRFFSEYGADVPAAEQSVAGAVFATMRAFALRRPDLGLPIEAGFAGLARQLSWEIEGRPWAARAGWHARLLIYCQAGRPRPRAALAQLRAASAMLLPTRVRAALTAGRPVAEGSERLPAQAIVVPSRTDALERLRTVLSLGPV